MTKSVYLASLELPPPPTKGSDVSVYVFGCQILAWILSSDHEVYGLLSTQDLEDAKYAAALAVRSPEISEKALEKIHGVAVRITEVLAQLAQPQPAYSTAQPAEGISSDRPDLPGGRLSPIQPQPNNQPPAPVRIPEREWSF